MRLTLRSIVAQLNRVISNPPARAGEARNPGLILALRNPMKLAQTAAGILYTLLLLLFTAPPARAEYIVLQSGLRLHVTGYQLLGEKYRLQLQGGWMDVSVSDVVKIEPEEVFASSPQPSQAAAAPATNQP